MAAPVIKSRTNSGKAVQFSNSYIARSLTIPPDWLTLRIGLLAHMGTTGATIPSIEFGFGLCSGLTSPLGTYTVGVAPKHYVGCWMSQLDYFSAGGVYTATFYFRSIVNGVLGTLTSGAPGVFTISFKAETDVVAMKPLFIEITRASTVATTWSLKPFFDTTSSDVQTWANSEFLAQMIVPKDACSRTGSAYGTAFNVTVDEATNGTMDSLNIYWSPLAVLEVLTWGLAKIA